MTTDQTSIEWTHGDDGEWFVDAIETDSGFDLTVHPIADTPGAWSWTIGRSHYLGMDDGYDWAPIAEAVDDYETADAAKAACLARLAELEAEEDRRDAELEARFPSDPADLEYDLMGIRDEERDALDGLTV